MPRACPECGNVDLLPLGFGTQRLEQAIRTAFPAARVVRVDRDTTRTKDAFAAVRKKVEDQAVDILVGTQMLAKGHDFPRLTLVGVLGADNALYSADFRATERLAALLMQVAGRAGRADLAGEVIVQTDFPAHAVYRALAAHDYARFADELVSERAAAQLPPAARIALLVAEAHVRADVDRFLDVAFEQARALCDRRKRCRGLSAGARSDAEASRLRARTRARAGRASQGVAGVPAALARGDRGTRRHAGSLGARRRSDDVLTDTPRTAARRHARIHSL